MEESHLKVVQHILQRIKDEDVYDNGFSQDKDTIEKLFQATKSLRKTDIFTRLTVIDSLYSTHMNRRYYGLDELADSLFTLAKEKKTTTKKLFKVFASNPKKELFDFHKAGNCKETNLFDEKYGIGKDGRDKGIAISLISKYAYFDTDRQFPIYDSIACEMFPLLWKYCGLESKIPKLIIRKKNTQHIEASATMVAYVEAINTIKSKLGGVGSYDYLDRLLWFTGKIKRGNLSLVLSRDQYIQCVEYSRDNHLFKETDEFCIGKVENITDLPFLPNNSLLQELFSLAKEI